HSASFAIGSRCTCQALEVIVYAVIFGLLLDEPTEGHYERYRSVDLVLWHFLARIDVLFRVVMPDHVANHPVHYCIAGMMNAAFAHKSIKRLRRLAHGCHGLPVFFGWHPIPLEVLDHL